MLAVIMQNRIIEVGLLEFFINYSHPHIKNNVIYKYA